MPSTSFITSNPTRTSQILSSALSRGRVRGRDGENVPNPTRQARRTTAQRRGRGRRPQAAGIGIPGLIQARRPPREIRSRPAKPSRELARPSRELARTDVASPEGAPWVSPRARDAWPQPQLFARPHPLHTLVSPEQEQGVAPMPQMRFWGTLNSQAIES